MEPTHHNRAMAKTQHLHLADLLGVSRLAVGATVGATDLAEQLHATIAAVASPLGRSPPKRTRGIAGLVYGSVRGVTRLVGAALEAVQGRLAPPAAQAPSSPEREAALAILNGVCGDRLAATGNPLAIRMAFRQAGRPLPLESAALAAALPDVTGKILVLAHGLCRNDLQWSGAPSEEAPLAKLARELGYTPVTLHYNTGLPIAVNGRRLAGLLQTLIEAWPVPAATLAIVGHSMGGLVARSACHHSRQSAHAWPDRLQHLFFLGSPHQGAPLERGGHWLEEMLGHSPYAAPFARLGRIRSAGITDLRHGRLLEGEDGVAVPLPEGVAAFAVAGTLAKDASDTRGGLLGDGLVPVASALGLKLAPERQWVAYGTGHLRLVTSPAVGARLGEFLTNCGR